MIYPTVIDKRMYQDDYNYQSKMGI